MPGEISWSLSSIYVDGYLNVRSFMWNQKKTWRLVFQTSVYILVMCSLNSLNSKSAFPFLFFFVYGRGQQELEFKGSLKSSIVRKKELHRVTCFHAVVSHTHLQTRIPQGFAYCKFFKYLYTRMPFPNTKRMNGHPTYFVRSDSLLWSWDAKQNFLCLRIAKEDEGEDSGLFLFLWGVFT